MVEDQSEGPLSNSRFDDRFLARKDYALKARKPYTVTKQREKWTQEEHIKFLEALKLYGRSWRQIEEHVGNKTAVQIRSHAQKFFSKVVRESSGVDIEIPPPRAKRKPSRPYPRKVSVPLKKGGGVVRSSCHGPHSSTRSNHENMSPSSGECVSTQSLKLFGKIFFVTGSARLSSVPWDSMPILAVAPECPTTRILQSGDRIEPKTHCCSQDSKNGEFVDKGERCAKGFVPYKRCLVEESCMLTSEEREDIRVRLCL